MMLAFLQIPSNSRCNCWTAFRLKYRHADNTVSPFLVVVRSGQDKLGLFQAKLMRCAPDFHVKGLTNRQPHCVTGNMTLSDQQLAVILLLSVHLARTVALSESARVTASAPASAFSSMRVTTPARNATPAALHRCSSSPRSRRRHTLQGHCQDGDAVEGVNERFEKDRG